MRGERVLIVNAKVSKREMALIERRAKAQGVTVSEYLRGAVMLSALLDGDAEAFKLIGSAALRAIASRVRGEGEDIRLELA